MKSLEDLRARLDVLDRQLLEIVAERQALGKEDRGGQALNRPVHARFPPRTRGAAQGATRRGGTRRFAALAESILQSLIRGSLTTQEQARVAAQGRGTGRSALVIGGRGKMGRWTADFLASQGFRVTIADPIGEVPGYEWFADWQATDLGHDLIIVATPLKIANDVLLEIARRRPHGSCSTSAR